MASLTVSEMFGPTVQGEGPSQGRRAGFLRLGRCNLDCGWCDTPFTWDWQGKNGTVYDPTVELSKVPVEDVAAKVVAMNVPLLVVTGGEPLIQQRTLPALFDLLPDHRVEIETNGTFTPTEQVTARAHYNVSPKLANSGITEDRRINPEAITALRDTGKAAWKFVTRDHDCLEELDALVARFDLDPSTVWVMPEGRNQHDLGVHLATIADRAVQSGYNLTGRLHVTVWGDERGR